MNNNWNEISLPSYEIVEAPGEHIVQAWYNNDNPELLITKNSNGEFEASNQDNKVAKGLATFEEAAQNASNLKASRRKASGFINIPKSKWTQYVNLWDDGTDPDHEYKDLTSVNIVDAEDPDSGNFGDMGYATFKNGDALIFNSNGSKTLHDVSADEAMRLIESGDGINASKHRRASRRKSVTVRKAEDGSFTITTDPGFSATMTQTDDGVDGMVNGEEQHFDTMDEAVQYVADNTGLDIDGSDAASGDATAARRRRSASRTAARRRAARWIKLDDSEYYPGEEIDGKIADGGWYWDRPDSDYADDSGSIYHFTDGTWGVETGDGEIINHNVPSEEEAKDIVLKHYGAKIASVHNTARRRAAIRRAKVHAAAKRSAANRTTARKTVRMTAAQRKELAARIAKARRIANASSSNKSMREAALNAARKKAARNPRLASASTAASTDAALSLI